LEDCFGSRCRGGYCFYPEINHHTAVRNRTNRESKRMKEIDPHLPIDSTAARVVSIVNEAGIPFKCGDKIVSMSPLPTMAWPYQRDHDMTGRKVGRFTVIGYSVWKPKSHQPNNVRWVVKCSCGRYQIFTTKTVKRNNPNSMCEVCHHVQSLKNKKHSAQYEKYNSDNQTNDRVNL